MNAKHISLLVLGLLWGCKGSGIEPGEVAAVVKGYVFIDNWSKPCGSGGLVTEINNTTYIAGTPIPGAYEGISASPLPVWIRYELDVPDTCAHLTNRIKILTIRKRD